MFEIGIVSISEPSMVKSCRLTGEVHKMKVSRMKTSAPFAVVGDFGSPDLSPGLLK